MALLIGGLAGLLQGMVRGANIELPAGIGYYQLLTAHGILMALVFTTFFIIGFLYAGVAYTAGGTLLAGLRKAGWWGYYLMAAGTVMVVIMVLLNKATVLYTFYAPLKASPIFYLGLTLIVVGSWVSGFGLFAQYRHWRRTHPGQTSPLLMFMSVITMAMWLISTIGVAVEVLLLLPWSMGWIPTVNVMLSRTLFWYFGHPLVLFLAAPDLHLLVHNHSQNHRRKNIQRRSCAPVLHHVPAILHSGGAASSIDGAGDIARVEIGPGHTYFI